MFGLRRLKRINTSVLFKLFALHIWASNTAKLFEIVDTGQPWLNTLSHLGPTFVLVCYKLSGWRFCASALNVKLSMCSET